AFDVGLDQLGRDQRHRMPERLQQPRPVMARTTGFDRDHRRYKLLEERHHLLAPQLLAQNRRLGGIHAVKLENVLRRIHADADNLFHGRSPVSEITTTASFWHARCLRGPSTPTTVILVTNSMFEEYSGLNLRGSTWMRPFRLRV